MGCSPRSPHDLRGVTAHATAGTTAAWYVRQRAEVLGRVSSDHAMMIRSWLRTKPTMCCAASLLLLCSLLAKSSPVRGRRRLVAGLLPCHGTSLLRRASQPARWWQLLGLCCCTSDGRTVTSSKRRLAWVSTWTAPQNLPSKHLPPLRHKVAPVLALQAERRQVVPRKSMCGKSICRRC